MPNRSDRELPDELYWPSSVVTDEALRYDELSPGPGVIVIAPGDTLGTSPEGMPLASSVVLAVTVETSPDSLKLLEVVVDCDDAVERVVSLPRYDPAPLRDVEELLEAARKRLSSMAIELEVD